MRLADGSHLSYCSNIHPGESWAQTLDNVSRFVPRVRDALGRPGSFGLGLRLSAQAARTLSEPDHLANFKALLAEQGLYVFTLNGFPYGSFHGGPVKQAVYQPDWRDPARLDYTACLAGLLAELLPADHGVDGSISTVPGGFKPELGADPQASEHIAETLLQHAAQLVTLERQTGRRIALALEPEPCCLLETVAETVDFFGRHLHGKAAARRLAALTGLAPAQAEDALHRHLGICLDLCHAAVEFEDPQAMLAELQRAGIRVAKLQISAGLRLAQPDAAALDALAGFGDAVYLHQVVQRDGSGCLTRFVDLPEALHAAAADPAAAREREWRVHFHVPVFLAELPRFSTTQDFLREALALHRRQPISEHLEVETYTWDVLPPELRDRPVDAAIAAELRWVLDEVGA